MISFRAEAGPSKGKGVDPCNWEEVHLLDAFSEEDLNAQREMLANYEQINRIQKEEGNVPPTRPLIDLEPYHESMPKLKAPSSRRRSRSPKAKLMERNKTPAVVPKPRDAPKVTATAVKKIPMAAPAALPKWVQTLKPEPRASRDLPGSPPHELPDEHVIPSAMSLEDTIRLLVGRINDLETERKHPAHPPKLPSATPETVVEQTPSVPKAHAEAPLLCGVTPGQQAAVNFFKRVFHDQRPVTDPLLPPSDPSDNSSSDSGESSSHSNASRSGTPRHGSASP